MDQGQNTNGIYTPPRPDFGAAMPAGDIVLALGVEKKKSKSPLIIAGVVGVIILIVIIMLVILGNSKNERESFNEFANYLLYGNDSVEDINADYEYGSSYHLAQLPYEERVTFLEKSLEKYNAFLNKAPDAFKGEAIKYAGILELYVYLNKYPTLRLDDVLSLYVEGKNNMDDTIEQYFAQFNDAKYEKTREYSENGKKNIEKLVTALDIYSKKDCINEDKMVIKNLCKVNHSKDGGLSQANNSLRDFYDNAAKYNNLTVDVFSGIWDIKKGLYEE